MVAEALSLAYGISRGFSRGAGRKDVAAAAGTGDAGGSEGAPAGTFVHAADDEPLSLDPAQVEPGEGGETMILQVYERLVEIAPITQHGVFRETPFQADEAKVGFDIVDECGGSAALIFSPCSTRSFHRQSG